FYGEGALVLDEIVKQGKDLSKKPYCGPSPFDQRSVYSSKSKGALKSTEEIARYSKIITSLSQWISTNAIGAVLLVHGTATALGIAINKTQQEELITIFDPHGWPEIE